MVAKAYVSIWKLECSQSEAESNLNLTNDMKKGRTLGWMMTALFIVGMIACLAMLSSCTTTKVVTVEKVRTDTTYITKHQKDSVWLHDSIKVTEKGDTVRIERWHTKYVEKQVHDTTYVAKHDSIPVPYEVIKEVPRKVSKTERALMIAGILSMMAVIVFVAWKMKSFLPLR